MKCNIYDISAGIVSGSIMAIMSISYATLIFNQQLSVYLPLGVGLALTSTVILGLFSSFRSSFPIIVSCVQDNPAIIYALMATNIIGETHNATTTFHSVMISMLLCTFLLGCVLFVLGKIEISKIVRYIPFSVIGGFLAGTGWLLFYGSTVVMFGHPPTGHELQNLFSTNYLFLWLPGIIFAGIMLFVQQYYGKPVLMPFIIILSIIIFALVLLFLQINFDSAGKLGLLLGPFPRQALWQPLQWVSYSQVSWSAIGNQFGYLLTLLILVPLAVLLNSTSLQITTKYPVVLDKELKMTGFANALTPILGGGLLGYNLLSGSILNHQMGAKSRLSGVTASLFCLAILLLGTHLLNYLPKFILSGLLAYVGLELMYTWLLKRIRKTPISDYALILAIFLSIVFIGFLQGIVIGLLIDLFIFVFRYSRLETIENVFSGSKLHSYVHRNREEGHFLQEKGISIYVLLLKGFLFFGNVEVMEEKVKQRLKSMPGTIRYVLLCFKRVRDMDFTALTSFKKLYQFTASNQLLLIISDAQPRLYKKLSMSLDFSNAKGDCLYFPQLNDALEWCENQLLQDFDHDKMKFKTMRALLKSLVPEDQHDQLDKIHDYYTLLELSVDQAVCRQGDESDAFYYLERGFLDVIIEAPEGNIKISKISEGAFFGEMSYYMGKKRTATIVTATPCRLLKLSLRRLKAMEKEAPQLAIALHQLHAAELSESLSEANNLLGTMVYSGGG